MCEKENCCRKPENLKGRPQDYSSEQIRKYHGGVKEHPCVNVAKAEDK